jgi:hypothetical protein
VNIIFKNMLLLMLLLPIGVANADRGNYVSAEGWVDRIIDRNPAYIVIEDIKYRVPTSAKVSERYSDKPLRLRHIKLGMKVEYRFKKTEQSLVKKLESIEIIPQ